VAQNGAVYLYSFDKENVEKRDIRRFAEGLENKK
jgi:hypothetical protein